MLEHLRSWGREDLYSTDNCLIDSNYHEPGGMNICLHRVPPNAVLALACVLFIEILILTISKNFRPEHNKRKRESQASCGDFYFSSISCFESINQIEDSPKPDRSDS
ncbi:hypothetical protein GQX74_004574 [Glossina fuscipes]|nr:hypothetical protein GQX74_004574 [Glossina fuscipes]